MHYSVDKNCAGQLQWTTSLCIPDKVPLTGHYVIQGFVTIGVDIKNLGLHRKTLSSKRGRYAPLVVSYYGTWPDSLTGGG